MMFPLAHSLPLHLALPPVAPCDDHLPGLLRMVIPTMTEILTYDLCVPGAPFSPIFEGGRGQGRNPNQNSRVKTAGMYIYIYLPGDSSRDLLEIPYLEVSL